MPPETRAADNPWPQWPQIFRMSPAHEEGGERLYSVSTQQFVGDRKGRVRALQANKVEMVRKDGRVEFVPVPGSEFEIKTDLVLLAMGFIGPERGPLLDDLGVTLTSRGNVGRDARLDDQRARRLHRRRHAARPVAHRLGDCRGTLRRARN